MDNEKVLVISFPVSISVLAQTLVFASFCVLSFFVPFSLAHSQWLVGTVVNTCLFLGAVLLPKKFHLPLTILPSLGVLARGLVFGPFTYFLVYFLPFIWLGNYILMLIFRSAAKKFGIAVFGAAVGKFAVLILMANIYFNFHLVPKLFLQTMGLNQLATALAGGLVSWIIFKLYGKFISRSARAS